VLRQAAEAAMAAMADAIKRMTYDKLDSGRDGVKLFVYIHTLIRPSGAMKAGPKSCFQGLRERRRFRTGQAAP
jgi:hypothetical protein